jgi:hypothetical protein
VTLDVPLAPIRSSAGSNSSCSPAPLPSSSDGDGAGLTVQTIFVGSSQPIFPPLSGAAELGEKIRSSPPVLQISKPFQKYYRKARELREGHSVEWNELLLADSLAASRPPFLY